MIIGVVPFQFFKESVGSLDWRTISHHFIQLYHGEHSVVKEVLQEHPLGDQSLLAEDLGVPYEPLVLFPDPESSFFV